MAIRGPRSKDSKQGISWFFNEIRTANKVFNKNTFTPSKDPFIGGVFFFFYDPKYKETLPFYDKFPIVIPIEIYNDGFLGLNLHYLEVNRRKQLLDYLLKYKTKTSTRNYMKLSYDLLKTASKVPGFDVCIHRYLTSHIKSRLVKVNDAEWEKAVLLPVQKFVKGKPY